MATAKAKRLILSTRALTSSILENVKMLKVSVEVKPFIRVEPVMSDVTDKRIKTYAKQKIVAVFTSAHALEMVKSQLKNVPDWQVYCTSGKTQLEAASFFGVDCLLGSAKNSKSLSTIILKNSAIKRIVFFCGDKRMDTIPRLLKEKGIEVEEVVVYKTTLTPQIIEENKYNAILFFSPSAVESFFTVNKVLPETLLLSIGQTTADAIKKHCNNTVLICEEPTEEAIIQWLAAISQ